MNQEVSVCVFAGHTGGHLFPAVAFVERFKRRYPSSRICLISSPKARVFLGGVSPKVLDQIEYLNEFPLFSLRGLWNPLKWPQIVLRSIRFLLEFRKAFFISSRILDRCRPDLCVGFGSYVSYPGIKLGVRRKIPALIHEQNKIAGKATRKLAANADLTVFSFPETVCRGKVKRSEVAGLPLRSRVFDSGRSFYRSFTVCSPANPLRLLIVGGSQGAHRLNQLVLESFLLLSDEEREKVAVKHITGSKDFGWADSEYKKMKLNAAVYPFCENMQDLYRESDFALTRAGANTLFELALFGLPALVVPFPYSAENHQEVNARYFESNSAVCVRRESDLDPQKLMMIIRQMFAPDVRRDFSVNLSQIVQGDAAEQLVNLAGALLPKEKQCP